ncbi:MAG: hypothetical protein KatS3mg090_0450 [Patescibacteria group bacterium]|nr:MAG: hypothetical protein KatS3mg090_0450 [Patescibacteria group bacterium]
MKANQLEIHRQIRKFLEEKKEKVSKTQVKNLVSFNFDSKNYFFAKADERWLEWLWKNGLLDILKKPAKDPSRYSYSTPEIRYLVRMAKSENKRTIKTIIDIICDDNLATSKDKFNPELIDQILRILSDWEAKNIIESLKRLEPKEKIREWIKLMSPFGITINFSLGRILKKLVEAREYDWAIKFADYILTVKDKSDFKIEEVEIGYGIKLPKGEVSPFYISES